MEFLLLKKFMEVESIARKHHVDGLVQLAAASSSVDVDNEVVVNAGILIVVVSDSVVVGDEASCVPVKFLCKFLLR